MMGLLIGKGHEALSYLPIEELAEIPGSLPDELSIEDIAKLYAPQDKRKQNIQTLELAELCQKGEIPCKAPIDNWDFAYDIENGKFWLNHCKQGNNGEKLLSLHSKGLDVKVNRDDFKRYLQSVGKWPLENYLLANWWTEPEPQAEALNGAGNGETKSSQPLRDDKFISLDNSLTGLMDCMEIPPGIALDDDYARVLKSSKSAAKLHQALTNLPSPPRWMEVNKKTHLPVFNDNVATEGMAILEHAAQEYDWEIKRRSDHVDFCSRAGLDPDIHPMEYSLEEMKYPRKGFMRPFFEIGFDRAELVAFFDANKIQHSLTVRDNGTGKKLRNKQRDDMFRAWIDEVSPNLKEMTRKEIQKALMDRYPNDRHLWLSGYPDWWKQQKIFKGKPGRKPG